MLNVEITGPHEATITIDNLTIANVPLNTWPDGGGPGLPRFTAVEIDWPSLLKVEGLPQATIEALVDNEERLNELLQEGVAEYRE